MQAVSQRTESPGLLCLKRMGWRGWLPTGTFLPDDGGNRFVHGVQRRSDFSFGDFFGVTQSPIFPSKPSAEACGTVIAPVLLRISRNRRSRSRFTVVHCLAVQRKRLNLGAPRNTPAFGARARNRVPAEPIRRAARRCDVRGGIECAESGLSQY